jgi:hypothetical protein
MFSVRSLVGATFALAISTISANAVLISPGVTAITAPNTYQTQNQFLGGTNILDVYTLTFSTPPALFGVSTNISLNSDGSGNLGIANLYYQWGGGPAVQVSNAAGVALDTVVAFSSLIQGVLGPSPLVITVFTANGGHVLSSGGSYQMRLTVSECDGRNCAPTDTPLPGAVVLFGSALAGGVGGIQLMRRRRKAKVA